MLASRSRSDLWCSCAAATTQELRVALDVDHQIEHLLGTEADERAAPDLADGHRGSLSGRKCMRDGYNARRPPGPSWPHRANRRTPRRAIALNKRARHEYFIEENLEAGMSLQAGK